MHFKISALAAFVLGACPLAAVAQFTDPFDSINPAWITNRFAPAGFETVVFAGDSRLRLTLDEADSAANRPFTFDSAFYNTQGRQRATGISGLWTLSAQVFVSSAFNTTTGRLVSTDLWAHTGTTPDGGDYATFGFTNASPTDALNSAAADRAFRFQVFDSNLGWVSLGVPGGFGFDVWHTLSATSTGTSFEYRLDGGIVYTAATVAGEDLLSAMIQGYNFGEAGSYSVHWDNVVASATIPEPSAAVLAVAGAAFGLALWHRRRPVKRGAPLN
jgi:hypothetical protein